MARSNLNRLEYFVAIAEAGSFTAAADQLQVSKAVVSKQLQLLEAELGATLILRNSRHLHLTEVGQSFYTAAQASVAQATEAYAMVRRGQAEPSGTLRITAPLDLGTDFVAPAVADFCGDYPAVHIDLTLSDTRLDPVEARFDIAFRVGWLTDSANIARKLADFRQVVVAAPELLQSCATPEHPAELAELPFIQHKALPNPLRWKFTSRQGAAIEVQMSPVLAADVTTAIKMLALKGAGVAVVPDFYVRRELAEKRLIQLLPEWDLPQGGIYALYPPTPYRSAATQRFAAFFADQLRRQLK
jgi:DNA-binding transcriptional LysR family regulator